MRGRLLAQPGVGRLDVHDVGSPEAHVHLLSVVERLVAATQPLHVLLRNSASPRCFGHGFERNALPEALELAHEALGDVLLVFSP
jgi:hypothetical protein